MTATVQLTPAAPPIEKQTTVGNYFVSNYPPFSFWKPEFVQDALAALDRPAQPNPQSAIAEETQERSVGVLEGGRNKRSAGVLECWEELSPSLHHSIAPPHSVPPSLQPGRALFPNPQSASRNPPSTPLGIYLHIPFCRKRCHFCYFKVYTDKDSPAIRGYIEAALRELAVYAGKPALAGRKANFVYFGGGTPSYLSVDQLTQLTQGMKKLIPWDEAEEVTFECEPGTLTSHKLEAIREMGVTRLSLGVENFDDHILEINGRAHHSKEIARAYSFARELGFPQINLDLIAGMVEETESNWRECVRKAIDLSPDSVTIYQMEVPYNTGIYQAMKAAGQLAAPVADWETKRAWVGWAFAELEKAGYTVGSAYTAVKNKDTARFLYRDRLWAGADLIGLGVASFGHLQGTHYQNEHDFEPYVHAVQSGRLPIYRAMTPSADERLIREFILQLKLGQTRCDYFQKKFGVDVRERFAEPLQRLHDWGFGEVEDGTVRLNREGLLQVDRLLHEFFLPEHKNARYA